MLKAFDVKKNENLISMTIWPEGKKENAFKMVADANTEFFNVVKSNCPEEFKLYECQASIALLRYRKKELPDKFVSMWY